MTHTPTDVPRRAGPLADLIDLVLPATCAACDLPGPVLCADCRFGWWSTPRRCEQDAGRLDRMDGNGPLPVWGQAFYQGAVRQTILAWKRRGRAELSDWLAGSTRAAARSLVAAQSPSTPLLVVPAPPSVSGRRRRGEDLLRPLARAAARGLTDAGLPARALPVLRAGPGARDQIGMGRRERGANISGRVALTRPGERDLATAPPGPVLLLDDVLTTGATLAACRDLLERVGRPVVGALVLAATPTRIHSCAGVESQAVSG